MSYGSNVDENGNELRANGSMPLLTGERVPGHTIEGLVQATDPSGNVIANRYDFNFRQSNGKLFSYAFFDSQEKWAIDKTNRTMLHICTRIVSEEEYYAVVRGATSFHDFMDRISKQILPKAQGHTYTLKIVYIKNKEGKYYAKFPNYPNFIELDGTEPSTLKTDPKYDIYVIPTASTDEELETSDAGSDKDLF